MELVSTSGILMGELLFIGLRVLKGTKILLLCVCLCVFVCLYVCVLDGSKILLLCVYLCGSACVYKLSGYRSF